MDPYLVRMTRRVVRQCRKYEQGHATPGDIQSIASATSTALDFSVAASLIAALEKLVNRIEDIIYLYEHEDERRRMLDAITDFRESLVCLGFRLDHDDEEEW